MAPVWWLWIPITLAASSAQTIRNATQRHLQEDIGTLGATFVRFAFAIPFAVIWFTLLAVFIDTPQFSFSSTYFAWLSLGALSQITGTALMLRAIQGELHLSNSLRQNRGAPGCDLWVDFFRRAFRAACHYCCGHRDKFSASLIICAA
jgi:ABC-type branched-subunit amino acid transport system permease subunit